MDSHTLVSIIINNYNYDRYVRQAIESALSQSYRNVEVIIVDDGSSDGSRAIIQEFQEQARIIMKENGGQASAFNLGFKISKGDIILFLDADDCLMKDTVEKVVEVFNADDLVKIHWPLWVIDEHSHRSDVKTPASTLPDGSLLDHVIELGPNAYLSPPTSGNAWSRKFLEKVLPMPEEIFTISADNYLCMLAPVYGTIKTIRQPLGLYRLHGKNNFRGKPLQEDVLQKKIERYEQSCLLLKTHLSKKGIQVNVENWNKNSWLQKLNKSISDIKTFVPENETFILADGDQWQIVDEIAGRNIIPFMEKNNRYWGPPEDDDHAIHEIERHLHRKAGYIFFAWPVFWWLDHYKKMNSYLSEYHQCLVRDERLVGFKLNNRF